VLRPGRIPFSGIDSRFPSEDRRATVQYREGKDAGPKRRTCARNVTETLRSSIPHERITNNIIGTRGYANMWSPKASTLHARLRYSMRASDLWKQNKPLSSLHSAGELPKCRLTTLWIRQGHGGNSGAGNAPRPALEMPLQVAADKERAVYAPLR